MNNIENYFIVSLQMIKYLYIRSEKEYNSMVKEQELLSSESLKYITQKRNFKDIIKLARKEV